MGLPWFTIYRGPQIEKPVQDVIDIYLGLAKNSDDLSMEHQHSEKR